MIAVTHAVCGQDGGRQQVLVEHGLGQMLQLLMVVLLLLLKLLLEVRVVVEILVLQVVDVARFLVLIVELNLVPQL